MQNLKILKETKILLLIGLIDLLLTLILFDFFNFHLGCAEFSSEIEQNYFFRTILAKNPFLFAFLKIASLLLFLSFIEFVRQKNLIKEQKVKKYLLIGIITYLSLGIALTIRFNFLL